jgi:hypothetical protein
VSGVVEKYLANKHGDIDALELKTEKESVKINFPPHTAKTIMHKAEKGSHVTVTYETDQPKQDGKDEKKPKLKLVGVTDSNGSEVDAKSIKLQKPAADQGTETIKLTDYELLKDKKGELVGIKSGDKLFHIHKEDSQFSDQLNGFVNEEHALVYHIQKITINGQEYHSQKKAKDSSPK